MVTSPSFPQPPCSSGNRWSCLFQDGSNATTSLTGTLWTGAEETLAETILVLSVRYSNAQPETL